VGFGGINHASIFHASIFRARGRAYRADPVVQEALRASRSDQLAVRTLAPGETVDLICADGATFRGP
jgi:xylose isomerase